MVLILTDKFDVHADSVIKELEANNIKYYRFNLDVESLKESFISFNGTDWNIKTDYGNINSNNIACVWCRRPFVELSLQEQRYTEIDFKIWKNEWNKTLLGLYNSLKDIPWLNPLRKAYKGENKYYQMELAKEIGFNFPETVITNEKKIVEQFVGKHNKALFKLMSQEIYDMGSDDFKGLYTNVITLNDVKKFAEKEENPIVLQEYIDKEYEVRYTVVGKRHFICKIDSQASKKAKYDWRRYDIANTPHYAIDAPKDIKKKVNILLEKLGLEYGALDFIIKPNGEWVFLEINCMGQWLWIEQLTGLPISKAIVEWIKNHC